MAPMFELRCHIEGDRDCFLITISPTQTISQLSDQIYDERHSFFTQVGCRAADLNLTKVEENLRALETKGDIRVGQYRPTSGDRLLEAIEPISVVWPKGPRRGCLHVFVGLKKRAGSPSLGDQRPSKKRHLDDPLEEEFTSFWNILWNENADLIHRVAVVRDSDPAEDEYLDIPPTMPVLQGLPKILSCGDVFIRDQYDDACKDLESLCVKLSAVIITGHTGIGKTMFLYYLLALRLRNKQPTFFQFTKDVVIFFDDHGVTLLPPRYANTSAPKESWALIDSNADVQTVPPIFTGQRCPYFVVVAAPLCSKRWWSLQRYRPRLRVWYMEPFTLEELIQARELDEAKPSERDIETFFWSYGPSARECFAWCSDIESYHEEIRQSLGQVSMDTISKAAVSVPDIGPDESLHRNRTILVTPDDDDHFSPQVSVVSKHVFKLLFDQDAVARRRLANLPGRVVESFSS